MRGALFALLTLPLLAAGSPSSRLYFEECREGFVARAPLPLAGPPLGFVSQISPDGTKLLFSTLTGAAAAIAVDGTGAAYFVTPPQRLDQA